MEGAICECCSTAPDEASSPGELEDLSPHWIGATVPGTAAGALRAAFGLNTPDLARTMDTCDWWFRCKFPAVVGESSTWKLQIGGLATVADVWLNGEPLLHSENMFVAHELPIGRLSGDNEILMRFRALRPLLEQRRPRPRWKTLLASHQNLRWFRTTLLGRQPGWAVTPAPVGPWRPIKLVPDDDPTVASKRVRAWCEGDSGIVDVRLMLDDRVPENARLHVGEASGPLRVHGNAATTVGEESAGKTTVEGRLVVDDVPLWWPHTHGSQPLVAVSVELDGRRFQLGSIGFRTVEVDKADGGFRVLVNGEPVFCRGSCWFPIDPVTFAVTEDDLRVTLALVRDANMNMLRIPGGTVYEDERFWSLCDEMGILVWQDCMLGYLDPPDDASFAEAVEFELQQVLDGLAMHPALAVLCGGQEIEEQAAFFGLPRQHWTFPLIQRVIPDLVAREIPGTPYVSSSPTGGSHPAQLDVGVSHYFGIGSYLRDLSDARSCGSRFVSEGLAFATPPEVETVDQCLGGARRAGHDPSWKQALHHDTGRSWDTEDFRDFYVGKLFGVDPHLVRYLEPERALDLGRAAAAHVMAHVMTEWRRPGSACDGGITVAFRDLVPGAGWGIVDALGRPKAPWFILRRVLAPVAILLTDEGLNGLRVHALNDLSSSFHGEVCVELYADGEVLVERAKRSVNLAPRGAEVLEVSAMLDGFRDVSYAYRFAPPAYDVVVASLLDTDDKVVSTVVHLPTGLDRPCEPDLGLEAIARRREDGSWLLSVSTRRLAQFVAVDIPGFRPSDSWFHLPPSCERTLNLSRSGCSEVPRGRLRALNSRRAVIVDIDD